MLANIYLNVLDTLWVVKKVQERLGARLVRYADDCVILCRGNTDRILKGIKLVFDDLGLTLNEEKTRVVDARQEMFHFLGFSIGMKRGRKTGKMYPHIEPSPEGTETCTCGNQAIDDRAVQCNTDGSGDPESQ